MAGWPEALRQVVCSMIPRLEACWATSILLLVLDGDTEGEAPGLVVAHTRGGMLGRRLAARTRATIEAARHEARHTLLVFLDCSRCHERAKRGHELWPRGFGPEWPTLYLACTRKADTSRPMVLLR